MRLSKKVVAALSSQDVQQTIWLPRFVHLVTHAKTPAPDDLLARMARRGATLATMSLRLIDHTVQGRGPSRRSFIVTRSCARLAAPRKPRTCLILD